MTLQSSHIQSAGFPDAKEQANAKKSKQEAQGEPEALSLLRRWEP
jgi:hypothetical protein